MSALDPKTYLLRHQITYQPPVGSIFHRAIDRERWPITEYARRLQFRTALQAMIDPTLEPDQIEFRGANRVRMRIGGRRLFGFGGPW